MFREALTYDDIQIIPIYSEVETRSQCNLRTRFTKNYFIDKPYVSSPMDTITEYDMALRISQLGGVGCIHRFMSIEEQENIVKRLVENKVSTICASIGVKDSIVRLGKLINAGVNVILIDVAHGNTKMMKDSIKRIKETYPNVDVIAGNVATREGARNLCEWGADAIRVGIGNGCFTPEMKVLTDDGYKKISDIKVGDYVYTHKGELKEVIDTLMFDRDEEIMIINGIECTKNHEFFVIDKEDLDKIKNDDDVDKYGLWVESSELNDNYLLVDVSCV